MNINVKISKHSPDVSAAMNKFVAVISVMNQGGNHWVAFRLSPKEKILEVFDSMQPEPFSSSKENYKTVSPSPHPWVKHCFTLLSLINRKSYYPLGSVIGRFRKGIMFPNRKVSKTAACMPLNLQSTAHWNFPSFQPLTGNKPHGLGE
jgi:hypothetical protein